MGKKQTNQIKIEEQSKKAGPRNKILNGIIIIIAIPAFIVMLFYGSFVGVSITEVKHFQFSLSLLVIGLYFLLQSVLAIINNHYWIPKIKKASKNLPNVSIQIIGRNEEERVFYPVLNRINRLQYPKDLIKKIVLAIDGTNKEQIQMRRVFKKVFPEAVELNLAVQLSNLSVREQEQLIERHRSDKYLIVTQPHGGRREVKYTAFNFSIPDSDYIFHCDSDTLVDEDSLMHLAKTASGYNQKHPKQNPCGGVVGQIKLNNVFNYLSLQMQISYWYAFNTGRASQSLFKCVTTISGAMGLFNSSIVKKVVRQYTKQTLFGVKCVFGEDRHITSGIIENQAAVIYDKDAFAYTETPLNTHALLIQQGRWSKGFYRESLVFLPNIFSYSWWSVLVLTYTFFISFLAVINLVNIILDLQSLVYFMIFVFIATFLMSLRGVLRNCRLRFFHALLHPLFFFLFLLPLKIWAFITCLCQDSKGTKKDRWKRLIPVYVWIIIGGGLVIGFGIIFNVLHHKENIFNWHKYTLAIIGGMVVALVLHWLTWGLVFYVPDNKKILDKMYYKIEGDIFSSQETDHVGTEKNLFKGPSSDTI